MTSFSDRYTHIEKVAEGSFGDVYRAQDTQPRRPVAIKVLKGQYASVPNALHRFRAEAERTVTVNHPNVVTVLETGETETGMPYIVMEWMEGETLAAYQARCSDGKLTYSDMLRIVKQVGAGLTAAHAKGVLHRDIKPANILLSHGDQVAKLSDFGLAAALDGGSISQGSYQSIVGSAGYLAPEITEGGAYTVRSDVYSLGAVVYRLLTGQRAGYNAPPPHTVNRSVPRAASRVISKALSGDPAQRYASVDEFVGALERARLVGMLTRPALVATGLLVLVLTLWGVGVWAFGRGAPLPDESPGADVVTPTLAGEDARVEETPPSMVLVAIETSTPLEEQPAPVAPTDTPVVEHTPTPTETLSPTSTSTRPPSPTPCAVNEATVDGDCVTLTPTLVALIEPQDRSIEMTDVPQIGAIRELDGMSFVYVLSGDFLMGNVDEADDQYPMQRVYLDDYWIMQHEVTNGQYAACVAAGVCRPPDNDVWDSPVFQLHPVTHVSWDDAMAFSEWIGGTLPSEAQWEKGCRGDNGLVYPWGNTPPTSLQSEELTDGAGTRPVGSNPLDIGPYGASDMAASVAEWTLSRIDDYPVVSNPSSGDVLSDSAASQAERTVRGSSFNGTERDLRCYSRTRSAPNLRYRHRGFRVVLPGSHEETHESTESELLETTVAREFGDAEKAALIQEMGLESADVFVDPVGGALYTSIPAGRFTMGAPGPDDQQPLRDIYLDAYAIKVTEVTNAEYRLCVDAGICRAPANDRWQLPDLAEHPVVNVTWTDADTYARWLGGRLPTEAQWEKACRGTDAVLYPWGDADPSTMVGNLDNRIGDTAPVLTTLPAIGSDDVSVYGVRDMAGSVREWVDDWYSRYYYGQMPEFNPSGPEPTRKHTIRGGAYNDSLLITCVARHSAHTERVLLSGDMTYADGVVGFRVVLPVP